MPNPTGWVDPLGLTGICNDGGGRSTDLAPQVEEGNLTPPQTGGAARAAMYSENWPKASLKSAVEKFAGPSPIVTVTDKGKRIYKNSNTGIEVVEDLSGNYFRIYDPSVPGKRAYLDLNGKIPSNKTLPNGKQTGRTQAEYNEITHFNIEE